MAGGGGEIGSKYGNVSGFIFIFNLVVSYAPSPPMLLHLPPLRTQEITNSCTKKMVLSDLDCCY